jgi:hypothetical protein
VDAVSQLLSAVLLERRAQPPVQPRHEAAPPPAVMRHERLPAEPPSAATGGSAWPWPSRVEPGPSVSDGLRAWGERAGHHDDGAVDVPPPAQALYELSDDSSDASGSSMGGALDAMRDQPPVRDCEPLRAAFRGAPGAAYSMQRSRDCLLTFAHARTVQQALHRRTALATCKLQNRRWLLRLRRRCLYRLLRL